MSVVTWGAYEGVPIEVEVDLLRRLPAVVIVGLRANATQAAAERLRSAIVAAGLEFPRLRVIINLAPADLRKDGTSLDLPMALGVLAAAGAITPAALTGVISAGGLSTGTALLPVPDPQSYARVAAKMKKTLILPAASAAQAALVTEADVRGAETLRDVLDHLSGERVLPRVTPVQPGHRMAPTAADFWSWYRHTHGAPPGTAEWRSRIVAPYLVRAFDVAPTRYVYGVPNRPIGFATVPKGHIAIEGPDPAAPYATRHGRVVYDHDIGKEAANYELLRYWSPSEIAVQVREALREYENDTPLELDDGEWTYMVQTLMDNVGGYTTIDLDEVTRRVRALYQAEHKVVTPAPRPVSAAPPPAPVAAPAAPMSRREEVNKQIADVSALFARLKSGQQVRMTYSPPMGGSGTGTFTVGRRSHSAKYNTTSLGLIRPDGRDSPGNKLTLRERATGSGVSLAIGDMAAVLISLEEVDAPADASKWQWNDASGSFQPKAPAPTKATAKPAPAPTQEVPRTVPLPPPGERKYATGRDLAFIESSIAKFFGAEKTLTEVRPGVWSVSHGLGNARAGEAIPSVRVVKRGPAYVFEHGSPFAGIEHGGPFAGVEEEAPSWPKWHDAGRQWVDAERNKRYGLKRAKGYKETATEREIDSALDVLHEILLPAPSRETEERFKSMKMHYMDLTAPKGRR